MNGSLNHHIARREARRQADDLVREGLADEREMSRLLHQLHQHGYGVVRSRLVARAELLASAEPLIADWFAFDAAARV